MSDVVPFAIGTLVGLFMFLKPDFVLFRPSRKGKWIANIIGENNWVLFIRIIGVILAVVSGYLLFLEF